MAWITLRHTLMNFLDINNLYIDCHGLVIDCLNFQKCGMECFCGQQSLLWFSTCLQLCCPSPRCGSTRWPDSRPSPFSSWALLDRCVGESSLVSFLPICMSLFLGYDWNVPSNFFYHIFQ